MSAEQGAGAVRAIARNFGILTLMVLVGAVTTLVVAGPPLGAAWLAIQWLGEQAFGPVMAIAAVSQLAWIAVLLHFVGIRP